MYTYGEAFEIPGAFCQSILITDINHCLILQNEIPMSFEVEGKLHKVFETEQKTDSFRAREFVIQVEQGNYPQFIKFQLVQDRCDLIDHYNEGDHVKVYFDLRGREWNEKYFTNLSAWRVEAMSGADAAAIPDPFPNEDFGAPPQQTAESAETKAEDFDDLPF